ncbi:hypothetical protein BDDG_02158 [Blastomyces dermatitidis ATCC 18188]|uniref:Uncharacterized protein n=1 Tax=Ajellomyces dermatitidis (strain ATCC 18188 / CBS 674.68) TaxID=653446 RepID=F2T7K7_AJEDA|nr:hypothetical protein BDDG_02158 [Blastomyces dermatitidis ATCC 18188]EQL32229.1 hypothetical protein BDFG_05588 [Blastomyces dermatitidis ATCC 26199]
MVFSPCPRSQRSKGPASTAQGTSPPDDRAQDLPTRPSSTAMGNLSEERLALEAIFRSSTPQAGNAEADIIPEAHHHPRTAANRTKQVYPKASRISLIQLSHKIRRKLSRESTMPKKSSTKFKERGHTLQNGDQNVNPAAGIDIAATSDAEYDSDAHCIQTPQITERVTCGITGVASSPMRVLSSVDSAEGSLELSHDILLKGFDGTTSTTSDDAPGFGKNVPASNLDLELADSAGFGKFDTFESGFKSHLQAVSRRLTRPFIPGSSNFPEDIGKPVSGKNIDSAPLFESSLSRFSWESDPARTNDLSPIPVLQVELSQLKAHYEADVPSRMASAHSGYFPLLHKTSPQRTSSADRQSSSGWQANNKYRAQSRFIESFDGIRSSSASDPVIQNCNSGQQYMRTRSVSDGWISDGKRQGYGFHFVAEDDGKSPSSETNNPSSETKQEPTLNSDLRDLVKLSRSERNLECSSRASSESTAVGRQHGGEKSDDKGARGVLGCEKFESHMNSKESQKIPSDCNGSNKGLFSQWARFPSYSKAARNESAGRSDNVVARDFVPTDTPKASQNINPFPLPKIAHDKTDSLPAIKRGTGLFHWLHRSDSLDRRRYRAGHRKETSRSDDLKDPDLEIIPGGPTGRLVLEQIGDFRDETKRQKLRLNARESSERVSEQQTPWSKVEHPSPLGSHPPGQLGFSTFDGSGMDASMEPWSADIWSRLYEDCIGAFSDDGEVTFEPGSEKSPEKAPIDKQRHDQASTSIDLRSSTAEFKEEQLLNEVGSKDGLLKLVEQAWGGK